MVSYTLNKNTISFQLNLTLFVILGAAVQAAKLAGSFNEGQTKDFKFLDVLPLSLGTEVKGGISNIIIPRNTSVPASRTAKYTTEDNQTSVYFKLLEGDRLLGKDNNFLGEMLLSGIPPMPRHKAKLDVTFTIDVNGTLHTKAVERSTGKSCEAKVHYTQKRLTEQEMDQMIADAEKMRAADQKRVDDAKASNELESYCLDLKEKVESDDNMSEVDKTAVNTECGDVLDWLTGGNRSKDECRSMKQELKTLYLSHK